MSWFQPPAPRFVWSASYIRTQGKIALLEDGHYIWEDSDRRRIASQSSVPIADMRDRAAPGYSCQLAVTYVLPDKTVVPTNY
jgi:hypothetical protein